MTRPESRNILWLALPLVLFGAAPALASDEEFVGPLASWQDAKKDYGAVGNGTADDTAALQKGLDALRPPNGKRVLYLPMGAYRITDTLKVLREAHSESQGITILGEGPEQTLILWDGPKDGVMMRYEAWYSRMGRITFDGAGKAKTAIEHGKPFVTANEFADMVFKNVGFGIEAGMRDGIAETAVLRCRFESCSKAGISIQNFNSLDWWMWHCAFQQCAVGITNERGAGHFHAYGCVFYGSTEADMTMKHCSYFGIRGNYSSGSKAFFVAKRADNWTDEEDWGAQTTLQGNWVIRAQDPTPVRIANTGNVLLLDNIFWWPEPAGRGVMVEQKPPGAADMVTVSNTFPVKNAVANNGRYVAVDDEATDGVHVPHWSPAEFAPRVQRKVFEVPAGADTAAIQKAIEWAAKLNGQRPVVHLCGRNYQIDRTLVIPAGCDVQLLGDGILNATDLSWAGQGEGPVILLKGPSRATLSHFLLNGAGRAVGIVVEKCDQKGARVFMEQAQVGGRDVGFFIDRLDEADVSMCDVGHSGCKVGVKVVGGPLAAQGKKGGGRCVIFSGASSNNDISYELTEGARLLARDIWYESGEFSKFLRFTGSGEFTLHGATVAVGGKEDAPAMLFDNFKGKVAIIGASIHSVSQPEGKAIIVRGDGKDTKLLVLGSLFGKGNRFVNESPHAQVGLLNNRVFADKVGTKPLANEGTVSPEFLREMLKQTREQGMPAVGPVPEGVTDVRLHRVFVAGCTTCIHLKPGE